MHQAHGFRLQRLHHGRHSRPGQKGLLPRACWPRPSAALRNGKRPKRRDHLAMRAGVQRHLGVRPAAVRSEAAPPGPDRPGPRNVRRACRRTAARVPARPCPSLRPPPCAAAARRLGVGGEGQRRAPVDVARELVGQDQIGQRADRAVDPMVQPAVMRRLPEVGKRSRQMRVDRVAAGIPALGADLAQPESRTSTGSDIGILPASAKALQGMARRRNRRCQARGPASSSTASTARGEAEGVTPRKAPVTAGAARRVIR